MIRVGLADDQVLVRTGFAALLDAEDDMQVAGQAANGEEALRLAARERPDVLLMDVRMPVLDGIEATRQIAGQPGLAESTSSSSRRSSSTSTSSRACGPGRLASCSRTPMPPS